MTDTQTLEKPLTISAKGGLNGHEPTETFKCTVKVKPLDIIVYVPGTTDPVNSASGKKNAADLCYWVDNPGLVTLVEDLRKAYVNVYVNKDFSWNGDNSKVEREKAGISLKNYLLRYYSGRKDQQVMLHLIGHSHGGNVINEFSHAIDKDKDFPEKWKIKSVTFLSVPFFKKLHPLNVKSAKFHASCKIINVYNHFDLTQRVVADFSMKQMGLLIDSFENSPRIQQAKKTISELNFEVYAALRPSNLRLAGWLLPLGGKIVNYLTVEEGRAIWETTLKTLKAVDEMLDESLIIFTRLNTSNKNFISDGILKQLNNFVVSIRTLLAPLIANFSRRLDQDRTQNAGQREPNSIYTRTDFGSDLAITNSFPALLRGVNRFVGLDENWRGPFTNLLDDILLQQIDVYDNTIDKPDHQLQGRFTPVHIPVRKYDPYNGLNDAHFDRFVSQLEKIENEYESNQTPAVRMRLLLTLLSEMNYQALLEPALTWIERLQWAAYGELDTELKTLQSVIMRYKIRLDSFHSGVAYQPDVTTNITPTIKPIPKGLESCPNPWAEAIKNPTPRVRPFTEQRGSLGYLAVTSHSISRLTLYPEVKTQLESALESGAMNGRQPRSELVMKKKVA